MKIEPRSCALRLTFELLAVLVLAALWTVAFVAIFFLLSWLAVFA